MKLGLKSGPKLKLYINNNYYSCAYYIWGLDHLTIPKPLAILNLIDLQALLPVSMLHAEKLEFISWEWAWGRDQGYFY